MTTATATKTSRKTTDAETLLDVGQILQEWAKLTGKNIGLELREEVIAIAGRIKRGAYK